MNDQLEQTPGQPTKPSLNKGLIIGLSAGIVILLAVVVYLLTAKQAVSPVVDNNQPTENQEQIVENNQSPTSDWQTYTNQEYGFEFKYPSTYKAVDLPNYGDSLRLVALEHPSNGSIIQVFYSGQFGLERIREAFSPTGLQDIAPEEIKAGQNTFYYYGAGGGGVEYPDQYFYNLNGKLLLVIFDGPYDNEKTPNQETKKLAPQILATFKLGVKNETTDWQTYKSEKYGFEFKYPVGWILGQEGSTIDQTNKLVLMIEVNDPTHAFSVWVDQNRPEEYVFQANEKENVLIGEQTVTAYIFSQGYECYGDYAPSYCSSFEIPIEHNNLWYRIQGRGGSRAGVEGYKDILSTFKFN